MTCDVCGENATCRCCGGCSACGTKSKTVPVAPEVHEAFLGMVGDLEYFAKHHGASAKTFEGVTIVARALGIEWKP